MAKIEFTKNEENEMIKFSKSSNLLDKLIQKANFPIYGHHKLKEALILQLLGGVNEIQENNPLWCGNIHMLLVGDSGCGISNILKKMNMLAPNSIHINYKSRLLNDFDLKKENLAPSKDSLICINNFYSHYEDNIFLLYELLDNLTIIVNKEGKETKVISKNSILVSSKPKFERFNSYDSLGDQLDLPILIMSKFDLIFAIKDLPNKINDQRLAKFTLESHKPIKLQESKKDINFIKKYIEYARNNYNPILNQDAIKELQNYYVGMRNKLILKDNKIYSLEISPLQLNSMIRLSEASARARLSNEICKEDAERAIELIHNYLQQMGIYLENGFDVNKILTDITTTQKNQVISIYDIITNLEKINGTIIPLEDIFIETKLKGIKIDLVNKVIEALKRNGDLFEPKEGFISRV